MRYQALIEYDGTGYFGFQRQRKDHPTIQGELEKAIGVLTRQPISVTGAGRTDSGVHALGQVVCFDADWKHGAGALQRAINANLPADIAVLRLEETDAAFHPRFDACRRTYAYHIYNAPVRSPIRRLRSWHVSQTLNLDEMNLAAARLLGKQDFATFGQPPRGDNTVREVFEATWTRKDHQLVFYIEATAFLHRMARSLVGSLKVVGEGTWTVESFVNALHARDRSRAAAAAPAHGLYLVNVAYDRMRTEVESP